MPDQRQNNNLDEDDDVQTFVGAFREAMPDDYKTLNFTTLQALARATINAIDRHVTPTEIHKHTHYHLDKNHVVRIVGEMVVIKPAPLYKVQQAAEAVAEAEARVKDDEPIWPDNEYRTLWMDGSIYASVANMAHVHQLIAQSDKAMDVADASYAHFELKDQACEVLWEREGRTP